MREENELYYRRQHNRKGRKTEEDEHPKMINVKRKRKSKTETIVNLRKVSFHYKKSGQSMLIEVTCQKY